MKKATPKKYSIRYYFITIIVAVVLTGAVFAADQKPDFSLAHVYRVDDETVNLKDYWVSEKYDGVRAWWDGRQFLSRGGKVFAAPTWFMVGLPTVVLDGELWLGRQRFEETSSVVRRQTPHEGWQHIRYLVFDLPNDEGTFRQRYTALQRLRAANDNPYWHVVEQHPIDNTNALEKRFTDIVAGGGEGLMLRRIESRHRGGRSDDLLKYKPRVDAEAVVIAHNPGQGKYEGMMGSVRLRTAAGVEFNVGSGFSDKERLQPPPIGVTVTYQYQSLTKKGIPRFPVFLRVRNDEPE